ncbi:hypothetical protein BIW11_02777 [Tropilaelaps mercedesae]|uniref:Uncharacterized protein n=1 Tax=Tropilaelaps mercedesae TaxID=418985 RepID=A0A1V9XXF3_9ACAR|nr:hypothetical protein BIW11_02777 [Tropilaelaps mercedesae]
MDRLLVMALLVALGSTTLADDIVYTGCVLKFVTQFGYEVIKAIPERAVDICLDELYFSIDNFV